MYSNGISRQSACRKKSIYCKNKSAHPVWKDCVQKGDTLFEHEIPPPPVWPDMAKFRHLGKLSKILGKRLRVYLVFGKIFIKFCAIKKLL